MGTLVHMSMMKSKVCENITQLFPTKANITGLEKLVITILQHEYHPL